MAAEKKYTDLLLLQHYSEHVKLGLFTTVGMQENVAISS